MRGVLPCITVYTTADPPGSPRGSGPHHIEDVRQWLQAAHLAVREVVAPSVQQPRDLGGFGPACIPAQLRLLARRQRTAQVATANQEVAIDARKSTD